MDDLLDFLDRATQRPVNAEVDAFARSLAQGHPGVVAVLAYGSALRESGPADTLIDYYLLVDHAHSISSGQLLRWLGDLIPPNVHYAEHKGPTDTVLRSKYAVMTLDGFQAWCSARTRNPYIWARFAQPSRLVWVRDETTRKDVLKALADAARTAFGHSLQLSSAAPWETLFSNTYKTELRPESPGRAAQIVSADAAYYAELSSLLIATPPIAASWRAKRILGKMWALARLAKAAFTFQGGADYAAWKIARHSGVKIEVTDWQRRHPFLAGLILLPKLLGKKGLS